MSATKQSSVSGSKYIKYCYLPFIFESSLILSSCYLHTKGNDSSIFIAKKLMSSEHDNKVFTTMSEVVEKYGHKDAWNEMYRNEVTPWNLKQPSLGLQGIKDLLPLKGRFIVPGCGEGYDVCWLALEGEERSVYGVDLSDLVVNSSRERVENDTEIPRSVKDRINFLKADFFDPENELQAGSFDFLFDYTFLCALHPSFRPSWVAALTRLLKSGAMLVTLMYPLDADERDLMDGPPFPLSIGLYHTLLDSAFELVALKDCASPPRRQGKEKIGIWKRK